MKRWLPTLLLAVLLPLSSCSSDDPVATNNVPTTQFADQTVRDNVVNNLEQAYNSRNIAEFPKLLDDRFAFHFGAVDLNPGEPERIWDRTQELAATQNLFSPNPQGNPPPDPATSITLDLTYAPGEDEWDEFPAPTDGVHDGETWYGKTVTYTLIVRIAAQDLTLQGIDIQASFVVREDPDNGEYRIIQWRDALNVNPSNSLGHAKAATEEATWGGTKALYN